MRDKLLNISPIDGRYSNYTNILEKYFSEYGLFKYRLYVELKYFIYLRNLNICDLNNISEKECSLILDIYNNFSIDDCIDIKKIENNINHDIKALEYFIQKKFDLLNLSKYKTFIHFGLTSQDINNNALTLSIKDCINNIIIPLLEAILDILLEKSDLWKNIVLLSHTHGQPAVPTTFGKEIKVFYYRIEKQLKLLKNINYYGKLGGAVGNLNAHYVAYPDYKWDILMNRFLKEELLLERNEYTTQIDNYENLSVIFDNLKRINCILIDMNKDIWQYISMNYLLQKYDKNHVGSSTMPHKINPINFENSEGNLYLANSLLNFMSEKLPISRLQRDLTDSTLTRNIGSIFGYMLISYKNFIKGFNKIEPNIDYIKKDLNNNSIIIIEGIQIILKKYGILNAYELCKDLSRNNDLITKESLDNFINNLDIKENIKEELYCIDVNNYIGNSNQ